MNTAYQTPEPFTVPDGGLASFLSATTGSWAEDENITPNGGISNVSRAADQLAQFGRNGDTYMVHAAEGETFIPKEVLEANPGLKESLFSQMRSMGVENPERYIVGSDLNSLNPITGQPEFFLSKAWKSIKGAVKSVVKVLKKAAPIIIPFAIDAFLPGLGSIAAGALGAGIGTLVQGGDIKDAFKSAALGGLAGGAMSGFKNAASGKSFFEGLGPTADPFKVRTDNWMTRTGRDLFGPSIEGTPVAETIRSPQGDIFDPNKFTGPEGVSVETIPPPPKGNFAASDYSTPSKRVRTMEDVIRDLTGPDKLTGPPPTGDFTASDYAAGFKGFPVDTKTYEFSEPTKFFKTPASPKSVINSVSPATTPQFNANEASVLKSIYGESGGNHIIKNFDKFSFNEQNKIYRLVQHGQGAKSALSAGKELTKPRGSFFDLLKKGKFGEAFFPREMTVEQLRASLGEKARYLSDDQLKALASRTKPSILAKYAPPLIAGIGGLYAAGGFDTPQGPTRATREQINKYRGYSPSIRRQMRGDVTAMAAGGGEMYPERIGAIAGPGTGVSDDVPALLSDGEFVMTAKAVRGAGNGSRDKGVRKMYQMMRRFEGGAV